jgi:hypothetical protein
VTSTIEELFWAKVQKTAGCWLWTASRTGGNGGYGKFTVKQQLVYAHRQSWVIHNGEIPGGMMVLHSCDNPLCVNPAHLFLGTAYDNRMDCIRKGRHKHKACPLYYT